MRYLIYGFFTIFVLYFVIWNISDNVYCESVEKDAYRQWCKREIGFLYFGRIFPIISSLFNIVIFFGGIMSWEMFDLLSPWELLFCFASFGLYLITLWSCWSRNVNELILWCKEVIMFIFNEHLKDIRQEQGKTQKEVAKAVGISESNYQQFEYGKVKPSFDTLIALSEFFDISIDYLCGRTENQNSHKQ